MPHDPQPLIARGRVARRDPREPRGSGGFGYDPLFFDPLLGKTGAELPLGREEPHQPSRARRWRHWRRGSGHRTSPVRREACRREAENQRSVPAATSPRASRADAVIALRGAAAAVAVHPHPVVRAQVSLLRFQFARSARARCRKTALREALMADLEAALPLDLGRRVHTVFFGGGTPSLAVGDSARRDPVRQSARACRSTLDAEITLEANPGTFEAEKFAAFRAAGHQPAVDRHPELQPAHLKALGRIHDDHEARRAIEIARANFDNINLDLMYGLPEQTPARGGGRHRDRDRIRAAAPVRLSPDHRAEHLFSPLSAGRARDDALAQNAGDDRSACWRSTATCITRPRPSRGPATQSRHNLNYWLFGDYLGIGAGAHSKISFADRIARQVRWKHPREYLDRAAAGRAAAAGRTRSASPTCRSNS